MIEINLINKDDVYKTIVLDPERMIWEFQPVNLKLRTKNPITGHGIDFEMKTKEDGFKLLRKIGQNMDWHVTYLYEDKAGKLTLSPILEYHEEN